MCGILFTNNPEIKQERFRESLGLMRHRGPDTNPGYYAYKGYKLGHTRLKILDLDDRSNGSIVEISAWIESENISDLHKLQGLHPDYPMTVTPTQRSVDDIDLTISGDGENVSVVTRQ